MLQYLVSDASIKTPVHDDAPSGGNLKHTLMICPRSAGTAEEIVKGVFHTPEKNKNRLLTF